MGTRGRSISPPVVPIRCFPQYRYCEKNKEADKRYSVHQMAQRMGIEPAYLRKIDRNEFLLLSEETIRRLASEGKPLLKSEKLDCVFVGDLFRRLRT